MHECAQRIRELINTPRTQHTLLKNHAQWCQLCSSLDVIEDTELAIGAYSGDEIGETDGARYLAVYGLLQVLFVQQDAVFHLCEALGISKRMGEFPRLAKIREIRNQSIGHPTKSDHRKPTSWHFISRITLRPNGFQLRSEYEDGTSEMKDISVVDLIGDQRDEVSQILASVIGQLEAREAAHKEKFRMEKLVAAFPDTLGYAFEKVSEAIARPELAPLGQWGLDAIKKALQNFREGLTKREEPDNFLKDTCELLEYAFGKLGRFFRQDREINEKDARIFISFIREEIDRLQQVAQEIDEAYFS